MRKVKIFPNLSFQKLVTVLLFLILVVSACAPIPIPTVEEESLIIFEQDTVIFGMLMVGDFDDNGWSEAHYNGALYAEQQVPGTRFIYIDNVNPSGRPGITTEELALELYEQGARIIIFNSDDMKADAISFSNTHPDVHVVHISGDSVWEEGKNYLPLENFTNAMGQMEYGKMMAGCSAALTTQTGKIAYLAPLENDETRRLAAASYLGARYCWQQFRNEPLGRLNYSIEWIGYWFNIPGVTLDPSVVSQSFLDNNFDVIISGIDTTEASQVVQEHFNQGERVWVIPFDYEGACENVEDVCLGVPYFNWGPFYRQYLDAYLNDAPMLGFYFLEPDWDNWNNLDSSHVGYLYGPALSDYANTYLKVFQQELSVGLNLWAGPLKYQDGSDFLQSGETATGINIWYLPKLLLGMRNFDS